MEKRYFLVNPDNSDTITYANALSISDDIFIEEAEKQGTVYSETGFVTDFNNNFIDSDNSYLRIINVNQ